MTCKNTLTLTDLYASPVGLRYKGSDKLRTSVGAMISIFIILLVSGMFAYRLNILINRTGTTVKKNTLVKVTNQIAPIEDIGNRGISFAFRLSSLIDLSDVDDSSKYGRYIFSQRTLKNQTDPITNVSTKTLTITNIPFSKCTPESPALRFMDAIDIKSYSLTQFYCPDFTNFTIQGIFTAEEHQFLNLRFAKCMNKAECVNSTQFDTWSRSLQMQVVVMSAFFDSNNYTHPIKHFFDDSNFPLLSNTAAVTQMTIKKINLFLNDAISGFFTFDAQDYFYQMSGFSTISGNIDMYGNSIFNMRIFLDKQQDNYTRQVYTLSMVLQDIGGFYTAMFFVGLITFSGFRKSLFVSAFVSQLFLFQLKPRRMGSGRYPNQDEELALDEEESPNTTKKKSQKKIRLYAKQQLEDPNSNRLKSLLKRMFAVTSERKLLNFSCCSVLLFPCARIFMAILSHENEMKKSLSLMKKGEKKLMSELDILTIVQKLRQVDTLTSMLIKPHIKALTQFQRKYAIKDEDTSSDDEQKKAQALEVNFSQIGKRRENQKFFKLFNRLQEESETLEFSEKRLIYGLVSQEASTLTQLSSGTLKNPSISLGVTNIQSQHLEDIDQTKLRLISIDSFESRLDFQNKKTTSQRKSKKMKFMKDEGAIPNTSKVKPKKPQKKAKMVLREDISC